MKRIELLDDLIQKRFAGNQADFARAIKRSPALVNQWMKGRRSLGDGSARLIEMKFELPQGYFDGGKTALKKADAESNPGSTEIVEKHLYPWPFKEITPDYWFSLREDDRNVVETELMERLTQLANMRDEFAALATRMARARKSGSHG